MSRFVPLSLLFLVVSCRGDGSGAAGSFRGVAVPNPIAKPQLVLTDFNGQRYDFGAGTRDKVALLFFGYTHCPDVCPLHMANIAAVLRRMPAEDRARVVTVFVTTDPDRDTPERLRKWLGSFDASFVGLTGTRQELARAQQALGLGEGTRVYVGRDSSQYFVEHGAQVFAFARDGYAYTIYPFGIRQEDWANDLPRLVADPSGARIRRDLAAQARTEQLTRAPGKASDVTMEGLVVTQALVAEPATQDEAAAYVTIRNNTNREDTLVAVAADLAVRVEVHETMGGGEMRHMMATPTLLVPARGEVRMRPDSIHLMLLQLRKKLVARDSVTLYLSLSRMGALEVRAPVVPYSDLQRMLDLDGRSGK